MLFEFALEPSLLNTWLQFRFFMSHFGVEHGRLISRYPQSWKKLVYESLSDCGDVERKRIEEALTRINDRLIKRAGQFTNSNQWVLNAEEEHLRTPFRAIIAATNPRSHSDILLADELDATQQNELWAVPRSVFVPRTPEGLTAAIEPLLKIAKRIIFVDPHFGPENVRHRRPLEYLLAAIASSRDPNQWPNLEYHLGNKATPDFFQDECQRQIQPRLPVGASCRFVRWRQGILHNRYVITDLGALQLGQGLDECQGDGPQDDCITLLGAEAAKQLLEEYSQVTTGNVNYVDEFTVTS